MIAASFGLFSAAAGVMAFVIFYSESSRHFTDRGKARRAALRGGAAAFIFFMALMIIVTILIGTEPIRRAVFGPN